MLTNSVMATIADIKSLDVLTIKRGGKIIDVWTIVPAMFIDNVLHK